MRLLDVPEYQQHAVDVLPSDARIKYGGYVSLTTNDIRAEATRQFGAQSLDGLGYAAAQSSGLRVRFRTAAQQVVAKLHYARPCDEACAIDLDKTTCYQDKQCHTQCEPKLLVEGIPANNSCHAKSGIYQDDHECRWITKFEETQRYAPRWRVRDFELIMPWGAQVEFRGVHLVAKDLPWDMSDATLVDYFDKPRLRYVAFGDSITHGWCGKGDSISELLAQLAGYDIEPINMGIQGLTAHTAASAGHGQAIANLQPDLVTIMIGVNDVLGGGKDAVAIAKDAVKVVDELRAARRNAVIVFITPTYCKWNDLAVEAVRMVMRAEVVKRQRTDEKLFLMEGSLLIAKDMLLEGLHPTSEGRIQLATKLFIELGYSSVQFEMLSCSSSKSLELGLSGLTPGGQFLVYRGKADLDHHKSALESRTDRTLSFEVFAKAAVSKYFEFIDFALASLPVVRERLCMMTPFATVVSDEHLRASLCTLPFMDRAFKESFRRQLDAMQLPSLQARTEYGAIYSSLLREQATRRGLRIIDCHTPLLRADRTCAALLSPDQQHHLGDAHIPFLLPALDAALGVGHQRVAPPLPQQTSEAADESALLGASPKQATDPAAAIEWVQLFSSMMNGAISLKLQGHCVGSYRAVVEAFGPPLPLQRALPRVDAPGFATWLIRFGDGEVVRLLGRYSTLDDDHAWLVECSLPPGAVLVAKVRDAMNIKAASGSAGGYDCPPIEFHEVLAGTRRAL